MKKIAALACTLLLSGALAAAASADAGRTEKFPASGIIFHFPEVFETTAGTIIPYGGTEIASGSGIYETGLIYFAMPEEEYLEISENPSPSEEETARLYSDCASLITVISVDHGQTFDDVNDMAGGTLDLTAVQEIASAGDCTHYLYNIADEALPDGTDAVYTEEFSALKDAVGTLLDASEFGTPTDPLESMVGSRLEFETTDTEGNPVTSEELFGSHEITMLNIWASWCGFCIDEMEELEAVNGRLAEKDCAVVGLLADGDKEDPLESGKATLKEKGVTYTNILPPANLNELFYIAAYPTTYFVNREGIIIGTPIVGAYIDQYEPAVEALLAENASAGADTLSEASTDSVEEPASAASVVKNDDSVYRVIVTDEDGAPIPEVIVQFCSDSTCKAEGTDETGTVVFPEKKGQYTVHILMAPEEYAEDKTEYTLDEDYCDLTVVLHRA